MPKTIPTGPELATEMFMNTMEVSPQYLSGPGMNAAYLLLGQFEDGLWLRRFLEPRGDYARAIDYEDDTTRSKPSVEWQRVIDDVLDHVCVPSGCCRSHDPDSLAVLKAACSLAWSYRLDLGQIVETVHPETLRLIVGAMLLTTSPGSKALEEIMGEMRAMKLGPAELVGAR